MTKIFIQLFFTDFQCKSCKTKLDPDEETLLEHTQLCEYVQRSTRSHRYVCFACDYNSFLRESMRKHIRKHTGSKPFKCAICSYCTTQNSALKTHMMIRHSCRSLVCLL
uniref:RE1-silencing transcription factor n=2 Tax=Cacopsylla melanoneura TaxID=428564 RepID=A0A8D8QDR5_9HEMI